MKFVATLEGSSPVSDEPPPRRMNRRWNKGRAIWFPPRLMSFLAARRRAGLSLYQLGAKRDAGVQIKPLREVES
jgi:hypothetical protein